MVGYLAQRVHAHKHKVVDGFTKKYNVDKLLYYETFEDKLEAARREWTLKRWRRAWKEELINTMTPERRDLYEDLVAVI